FQLFNERIGECTVLVDCAPHQALRDAVDPHGGDVQHGADGGQPEVGIDRCHAVHVFTAPEAGDHVIQRADANHRHPAEGGGVYVADGPVGVVGQGVDGLDGHHRTFEGGHA